MPSNVRVRGEDVKIRVTMDGAEVLGLDNVLSFSGTVLIDTLTAEFMGQVGQSVDEILNGAEGSMSLQWGTGDVFDFIQAIVDRAARRTAGVVINVQGQMILPDGNVRIMLFKDVAFGNIPINFASRPAYGEITLTWRVGSEPGFPAG